MNTLLQDPYTKYLAKFCKKWYNIRNKLDFNDILTILTISDNYLKIYNQAFINETPMNNTDIKELTEKLKWIFHKENESKHLIIIFQFLSNIIHFLELDINFRKSSKHFQNNLMRIILSIPSCKPIIINKNYTDLLMKAIHIDMMILNDGEPLLEPVESFIKNLYPVFEDIRKEIYTDLSKKIQPLKQELITTVMNPNKLQKMLDSGMELDEVIAIYSV